MSNDEGGVGITSCSGCGRFRDLSALAGRRVDPAFLDRGDACFVELLRATGLRRAETLRVGFAAFFTGFRAFATLAAVDLAALFRAPVFFLTAPVLVRAALVFLGDEADRDGRLAFRLAMLESFRNLDSLAISVVLSDAYRKSDGRFRASADRNRGPPDPAI